MYLEECSAVVAVIGRNWIGKSKRRGLFFRAATSRILQEDDWVRMEIEMAKAKDLRVYPVLVENAKIPKRSELPSSLHFIPEVNAFTIDPGRDYSYHVQRLIGRLRGGELDSIADAVTGSSNVGSEALQTLRMLYLALKSCHGKYLRHRENPEDEALTEEYRSSVDELITELRRNEVGLSILAPELFSAVHHYVQFEAILASDQDSNQERLSVLHDMLPQPPKPSTASPFEYALSKIEEFMKTNFPSDEIWRTP